MAKNQPDKAQLTIKAEERLSPDMVGIELGVKILDQSSEPVSGQPFKVHADAEVLIEGITNENGEFNGQRVLTVQEGMQRKVFLVLDDSAATDWKVVGEKKEEQPEPQTMEVNVKVLDATGKPLDGYPFKIQVDSDGPVDAKTDGKGAYSKKTVLGTQQGTQQKVSLVLKVATVLPKENTEPSEVLKEILSGKRAIKKGEEFRLERETYNVTNDVTVEEGGCLIIEPGVIMEFGPHAGIVCKGTLTAIGTNTEPIIFKASGSRNWKNITLLGNGTLGSHLEYCVIEFGGGRTFEGRKGGLSLTGCEYADYPDTRGGGLLVLVADLDFVDANDSRKIIFKKSIIRNNKAKNGAGIYCYYSSPTIDACSIESNTTVRSGNGGGLYLDHFNGEITFCQVSKNGKDEHDGDVVDGGGFYIKDSTCIIKDSTIDGNMATGGERVEGGSGGGLFIKNSFVALESCSVSRNKSEEAAGLNIDSSKCTLSDSKIKDNSAGYQIISSTDSQLEIVGGSKITGNNSSSRLGSSILVCDGLRGRLIIEDSEIKDNHFVNNDNHKGQLLFMVHPHPAPEIVNCEIEEKSLT